MSTPQARAHHYVAQWYQKKFLTSGQTKFHYLDLHPETISTGGVRYQRRNLLHWGPARCFYRDDLYTLKLANWTTDQIERRFFGAIDMWGQKAVEHFAEFDHFGRDTSPAFRALLKYMDAQRFRTPRGLDWLKSKIDIRNHSLALIAMQQLFEFHGTMWMEGQWEIVRAQRSPTKFIVTDAPVTFFHEKVFPGSKDCRYPGDVALDKIGTRTLFPLGLETCLIITHIQLVRNPWANPLHSRINARAYQDTMTSLTDIQFGRELEEDEVLRINYILKKRATRYIAAAEKEWLYPEDRVSTTHWSKLDEDWFLLPHLWKVPFTTGLFAGHEDGSKFAMNEYGQAPRHPQYADQQRTEREWISFHRAQRTWARKRAGRSVAHVDDTMNSDRVGDELMREYLAEITGTHKVSEA
jgi:Protein of unknown function (DUF4238)